MKEIDNEASSSKRVAFYDGYAYPAAAGIGWRDGYPEGVGIGRGSIR